jgi:predicted enzyme related to lactoylglutathione lyase
MAHVAHFAINADNIERARSFYGNVFGWRLEPWGPPGFYKINTGEAKGSEVAPVMGALQGRRELIPGQRTNAYECTIAVDSVDETLAAVLANGGKVILAKSVIAGVGALFFFEDPEGNVAGAIQFDNNAR